MKKITLFLKQSFPFAQNPRFAELEPCKILCNDITLPGDFNPHNTRLWCIGNEFGAVGAVWAHCEQDALDELVDKDMGQCFLVSAEDQKGATEEERNAWAHLGNAGEAADLEHAWIACVEFVPARDWSLMLMFAECRGLSADDLDDSNLLTRYLGADKTYVPNVITIASKLKAS